MDGPQLPLPIAPADDAAEPAPARARRARRTKRPRQLWLFAPYAQVDLPLDGDAAGLRARPPSGMTER